MNIKLCMVNDDKNFFLNLPDQSIAGDTLTELDIPPDTVIITKNGQPIPIDSVLADGDVLEVIRVLSGG